MRSLIIQLLCLSLISFVLGYPQLSSEDKPRVEQLLNHGATIMVNLMIKPNSVMTDVVKAIMNTKKVDKFILDDMEDRINKANSTTSPIDEKDDEQLPKYLEDIENVYLIYTNPKYQEKRNRFNEWTDGEFDRIMGRYFENCKDQSKSFVSAVRDTLDELTSKTKVFIKQEIEDLDKATTEEDTINAATKIYGKLFRVSIFGH